VDAFPGQATKQQYAVVAGSRKLGQIHDERALRRGAGVPQEGNALSAELPRDLDGREIGRLGHDQAKDHHAES
jgi:hypothetical protein